MTTNVAGNADKPSDLDVLWTGRGFLIPLYVRDSAANRCLRIDIPIAHRDLLDLQLVVSLSYVPSMRQSTNISRFFCLLIFDSRGFTMGVDVRKD